MKQDRLEEGRLSSGGKGLGTVTQQMIRRRAEELALINGRGSEKVTDADLGQARRELTQEDGLMPSRTAEEKLPEEDRWSPEGVSTGERVDPVPAPDEQTFAEKLVEEGVADAEHDQMVAATKASIKRDLE